MAVAALVVCGDGVLDTSRRSRPNSGGTWTYASRSTLGEEAPLEAKLPRAAKLNKTAQKYFKRQESGEQQSCWLLKMVIRTDSRRRIKRAKDAAIV